MSVPIVTFRRDGTVTVNRRLVGTWMGYPTPERPFREWRFENLGGRVFTSKARHTLRAYAIAAFNTQEA